jgi:hypothetical protein
MGIGASYKRRKALQERQGGPSVRKKLNVIIHLIRCATRAPARGDLGNADCCDRHVDTMKDL